MKEWKAFDPELEMVLLPLSLASSISLKSPIMRQGKLWVSWSSVIAAHV